MRPEDYVRQEEARTANESIFASFGRTIRDIVANVQEIIRSEVQLAKTEVKEEITSLKKVGIFFGATAICGFYAVGFILLGCVYALSEVLSAWLAALIVGVGIAIVGAVAFILARKEMQHMSLKAEQTIEAAKENVRWAKNRFK